MAPLLLGWPFPVPALDWTVPAAAGTDQRPPVMKGWSLCLFPTTARRAIVESVPMGVRGEVERGEAERAVPRALAWLLL